MNFTYFNTEGEEDEEIKKKCWLREISMFMWQLCAIDTALLAET